MKSIRQLSSKKNKTKNRKRRGGASSLFKILNNGKFNKVKEMVIDLLDGVGLIVTPRLRNSIDRNLNFLLEPEEEENKQKEANIKRDQFISEFGLLYSNRFNYTIDRIKELLLKILFNYRIIYFKPVESPDINNMFPNIKIINKFCYIIASIGKINNVQMRNFENRNIISTMLSQEFLHDYENFENSLQHRQITQNEFEKEFLNIMKEHKYASKFMLDDKTIDNIISMID
jgi:hypothetical protein